MIRQWLRNIRARGNSSTPQERQAEVMREVDEALGIKQANEVINATAPPPPEPAFDAAAFFAALRTGPLRHRKPLQVQGSEAILTAMHGLPISWVAYALATAWHETNETMQPVLEANWLSASARRAYFMRMYDKTGNRPHVARELGNTVVGDGATFAGRGYVQLTGRRNYAKAERKIGEPFASQPDLAMRPDLAARILREGMIEGWFTGRGFVAFLPSTGIATREQFRQARRIINGVDKWDEIAGEAIDFQAALLAGGWE